MKKDAQKSNGQWLDDGRVWFVISLIFGGTGFALGMIFTLWQV